MHDFRWNVVRFLVARSPTHYGLLVCLLFHLGGAGVREHNPLAAAVTMAYYAVDFLASFILLFLNSPGIGVVKVSVIALLFSKLRATWIAGNWKSDSKEAALPPRQGETFLDKFSDKWPAFVWPKVKVLYHIFSVGFLALVVASLIVMAVRGGRF